MNQVRMYRNKYDLNIHSLPTWLDSKGSTVYPERSEAGLKFEGFAALPFRQSHMNNNFLLDRVWGLRPGTVKIEMLQGLIQGADLSYRCNCIEPLHQVRPQMNERMRIEFKFIPFEKVKSYGFNKALGMLLQSKCRAYRFCQFASSSRIPVTQLLIIGMTPHSVFDVLSNYNPHMFNPIFVIAYLPTQKKGCVRKAVARFSSFREYAESIHDCVCPEQVFENILHQNGPQFTQKFRDYYKLP